MTDVHESHGERHRRIWPVVMMLLLVLLLIGVATAMIMNIRGSISWPAGRVEFGFRQDLFATSAEPVSPQPAEIATGAAPAPAPSEAPPSN